MIPSLPAPLGSHLLFFGGQGTSLPMWMLQMQVTGSSQELVLGIDIPEKAETDGRRGSNVPAGTGCLWFMHLP